LRKHPKGYGTRPGLGITHIGDASSGALQAVAKSNEKSAKTHCTEDVLWRMQMP
jgi:hypothetical protein